MNLALPRQRVDDWLNWGGYHFSPSWYSCGILLINNEIFTDLEREADYIAQCLGPFPGRWETECHSHCRAPPGGHLQAYCAGSQF